MSVDRPLALIIPMAQVKDKTILQWSNATQIFIQE
jgi:hypothetical protein